LIKRAAGEIFEGYFVGIDFAQTVQWFDQGNNLRLADTASAEECKALLEAVPELIDTALIPFDFKKANQAKVVAACELVLEGFMLRTRSAAMKKAEYSRDESEEGSPRDDLR